jgi:hypothetical protein
VQLYFHAGWRGWSDWLGLSEPGIDTQALAKRLNQLIPRVADMKREDVVAELKRLEVWRYPLAGMSVADKIIRDILRLPYADAQHALCIDIVDRIDRALLDRSDHDESMG